MNPVALYAALDAAARACLAADTGDVPVSSLLLWEAQGAATGAFLAGSPEAEGLARVLAAIGTEAGRCAA